jgi:hypothetical protein
VEPYHLSAQLDGFREKASICSERNTQPRLHKVPLEASCEGRMRQHSGDVGHQILGRRGPAVDFCHFSKQFRTDVGLFRCAVAPEWIYAPSTPVIVVEIGN